MKIQVLPCETKIDCICGCVFTWSLEDTAINIKELRAGEYYTEVYVTCPFCRTTHVVKTVPRK